MSLWDNVKNFMGIENSDFEDDTVASEQANEAAQQEEFYEPQPKKEPRIFQADRKSRNMPVASQMQVVIVKPDHFEDVTMIADHLNAKKSVVLNLEAANRETSRRIIDFISGVAYANKGSIRRVANSTFMIAPSDVDVMGELMMDDYS